MSLWNTHVAKAIIQLKRFSLHWTKYHQILYTFPPATT